MNLPITITEKRMMETVKSDVQNKIVSSKDKDICYVADAPRCERER